MLIALIVAPLGMMSGHAAMAMPTSEAAADHATMPSGAGHCPDMGDEDDRDVNASIECMIACAAMLPQTLRVGETSPAVSGPDQPPVVVARHGLNPGAEPPPPRLS